MRITPAQGATRKPAYWRAVEWIIDNDGTVGDALAELPPVKAKSQATRESLATMVIVGLLADMYGMTPASVAFDIVRAHAYRRMAVKWQEQS